MSHPSYPLPVHAAYVWLEGDRIMLGFPPSPDRQQGHSTSIPATGDGFRVMVNILREREKAGTAALRLGEKSEPTQFKIDEILKAMKAKVTPAKTIAPEDISLESLDL